MFTGNKETKKKGRISILPEVWNKESTKGAVEHWKRKTCLMEEQNSNQEVFLHCYNKESVRHYM